MSSVNNISHLVRQNSIASTIKGKDVSFGANIAPEIEAVSAKVIEKASASIENRFGYFGDLLKFMKKTEGEIQNQLGNAVFTSTLAPVVIAYNPISKESPETKKYSALRQPISAVLAIAFSLSATKPADDFVEKLASEGFIKSIDLRMKPTINYLKKEYAKAQNDGTLEKFIKENTPENWSGDFNVETYIQIRQQNAKKLFQRLIFEDPEILKQEPGFAEAYGEFIDKNNIHNKDFARFLKEHFNIDFFEEPVKDAQGKIVKGADGKTITKLTLKEFAFDDKLNKIKAIDFLRKTGLVNDKFTEADLKLFLSANREKALVEEFLRTGIAKNHDDAVKMSKEIGKYTSRSIQYNVNSGILNEESNTLKQLLEALKVEEKFKELIKNNKLSEALETFKSTYLKDLSHLKNRDKAKFAEQIIVNSINRAAEDFKNLKKFTGIAVALVMLPFSCGALNWAYPRFMEKFFPELANAKKSRGGAK